MTSFTVSPASIRSLELVCLGIQPYPNPRWLAPLLIRSITMAFRYKKTEPHQHDWQYTRTSGSQLQCVLCGKYESEK